MADQGKSSHFVYASYPMLFQDIRLPLANGSIIGMFASENLSPSLFRNWVRQSGERNPIIVSSLNNTRL